MKKPSLYNLLTVGTLVSFFLILAITIINSLHYDCQVFGDDPGSILTYQNYGIFKGVAYLYEHKNGRIVSHFINLLLCPLIANCNHLSIAAFYLANVLLLIFSLAFFLRSFFKFRYNVFLTNPHSRLLSTLLYSVFFFMFFEKRFEWWFWLSSITVYEYSFILLLIINGILLTKSKYNAYVIILLAIGCLALGFMSEIQALAEVVIITALLFTGFGKHKGNNKSRLLISAICLIILALLINYFSGGNSYKLQLSKTEFLSVQTIAKSVNIVISDVLYRWDTIIVHGRISNFQLNAVFAKLLCIPVFIVALHLVIPQWPSVKSAHHVTIPGYGSIILFSLLSVFIYTICLAVSAILYANVFNSIFDRCKLLGSFMLLLSLMDLLVAILLKRFAGKNTNL